MMSSYDRTMINELSGLDKKVTYLKIEVANISQRMNYPRSVTAELSACEQRFYAASNALRRLSGYKGLLWGIAYDLGRITLPCIHLAQKFGLLRNRQQTAVAKSQHSDERFAPYWIVKRLLMTHAQQKNHVIACAIQQQLNEISDQLTALRKNHSNYSRTVRSGYGMNRVVRIGNITQNLLIMVLMCVLVNFGSYYCLAAILLCASSFIVPIWHSLTSPSDTVTKQQQYLDHRQLYWSGICIAMLFYGGVLQQLPVTFLENTYLGLLWGSLSSYIRLLFKQIMLLVIFADLLRSNCDTYNLFCAIEYEDPPIISAIGLVRVDWGKFLRCISIFFLQYLVMGWSLLMSQPWHVTWYQWVISTLVNAVILAMQTLSEEVLFRRPIIDKQSPAWQSLYNIIISSLVFGFVHAYNPEFSVFQGDVLSQSALLGSYICCGITYALVAYLSGGLELVWGMHFAHNFFLTSIIGYTPCPIPAIPLITKPFSPFKSVGSFAEVAWLWSKQISNFFISCLPIYLLEMFYRDKYFVQPLGHLASEAASDLDITQMNSRNLPRETNNDSFATQTGYRYK